jgi:glucose-6-phosphate dehydrogenase assembly protein OpcA
MAAPVLHPLELGPPVPVGQITRALNARREELARACNDAIAMRVCTLNLVAFCHDEDRCEETQRVLSAMVVSHPGRMFLVHAHREVPASGLEARVAVDGTPAGAGVPPTYSELIDLKATGADVEYLPGLLTSLLESDQPACAWWATPPTFGPSWARMARICDRMVLDSRALDPWDLMRLAEFIRGDSPAHSHDDHAALGDLSWARIKPFMALVARFFDAAQVRERLADVEQVVVRHVPATGQTTAIGPAMLAAWLRDALRRAGRQARVKLEPRVELIKTLRHDLDPGEVVELSLLGGKDDPLELVVTRHDGSAVAEARRGISGMASQRQRLQTQSRSWLLAQELQIYGRDPLFEASFLGGIDLLREARQ